MKRLIDWKGKNASHNDKDICYLSFWMPFLFLFLVQCVNAKAMSWLSMVEYRDLCKLFFKLKIKKLIIHWCQVLGGDEFRSRTKPRWMKLLKILLQSLGHINKHRITVSTVWYSLLGLHCFFWLEIIEIDFCDQPFSGSSESENLMSSSIYESVQKLQHESVQNKTKNPLKPCLKKDHFVTEDFFFVLFFSWQAPCIMHSPSRGGRSRSSADETNQGCQNQVVLV